MTEKISARVLAAARDRAAKVVRHTKKGTAPSSDLDKGLAKLTSAVETNGKTEKGIALASERHLSNIAESLGDGQKSLLEQLTKILSRDGSAKVVPYRFTVQRDSQGLIQHIDAHPIGKE